MNPELQVSRDRSGVHTGENSISFVCSSVEARAYRVVQGGKEHVCEAIFSSFSPFGVRI